MHIRILIQKATELKTLHENIKKGQRFHFPLTKTAKPQMLHFKQTKQKEKKKKTRGRESSLARRVRNASLGGKELEIKAERCTRPPPAQGARTSQPRSRQRSLFKAGSGV